MHPESQTFIVITTNTVDSQRIMVIFQIRLTLSVAYMYNVHMYEFKEQGKLATYVYTYMYATMYVSPI